MSLRCLYFCYDGLLDPLGKSQVLPYVKKLVEAGHEFSIISYEKQHRSKTEIQDLSDELQELGVNWSHLTFTTGKIGFLRRITQGIGALRKSCKQAGIDLVHLRGLQAAVIFKLSMVGIAHLYDMRSFFGEWVDIGRIKSGSLIHRILRHLDSASVKAASGVVVLEASGMQLLMETYGDLSIPVRSIRTATDVSRYAVVDSSEKLLDSGEIKFVCLGGAQLPYRPDLALTVVKAFLQSGINAHVDFINEYDHDYIRSCAEKVGFPSEKMHVYGADHSEIPNILQKYDCALLFINTSRWRRVCSPTKLGEYLAAGLPVIALRGINVIDTFSSCSNCVKCVEESNICNITDNSFVAGLIKFLETDNLAQQCQGLAWEEFDLSIASKLYVELYAEIESSIRC